MPPTVTATICPTGGAILLNITLGNTALNPNSTLMTIKRFTGSLSAPPTYLLTNQLCNLVYLDTGDGLPSYLDFQTSYYYTVTDPTGTTTIGPIIPTSQLSIFSDYMDGVFFRLFSAGISSVAVPAGFKKIRVLESLPLTPASDGSIFPFVVMNLDLEQQENTQINR